MDTFTKIINSINKSFQTNDLNYLVSLKAFLCDKNDCPWSLFYNIEELEANIQFMQNKSLSYYKDLNTLNLKKFNINQIEIYLIPRNKRNKLTDEIDEILSSQDYIFITDELRSNPFNEDTLMNIISENQSLLSEKLIKIYTLRKEFLSRLFIFSNYNNQIFQTSMSLAKNNKIKEYWINIWGSTESYNSDLSVIESLIL